MASRDLVVVKSNFPWEGTNGSINFYAFLRNKKKDLSIQNVRACFDVMPTN